MHKISTRSGAVWATVFVLGAGAPLAHAQTDNTLLGTNAGSAITSGDNNTLIGNNTGSVLTSGSDNTFFGQRAGNATTSGKKNTFIGRLAGAANTTSSDNTYVGNKAGNVSTGDDNTFVGGEAGLHNTTGYDNTFIGDNSGHLNTTGKYNTFIGHHAGYKNTTATDNTFIGSQVAGAEGFAGDLTGGHNVAAGGEGLRFATSFDGIKLLAAVRPPAFELRTGFANTLLGAGSGNGLQSGVGNVLAGHAAGIGAVSSHFNTFVGGQAGAACTASRNTYIGFSAAESHRTGEHNVCAGAFTVIAGTGQECTVIGATAASYADGGIAIGYGAAAKASNATAIGTNAQATAANSITIGNAATTSIGGPVPWLATSDGRVKSAVRADVPGLQFIRRLRPVTYAIDAARSRSLSGSQAVVTQTSNSRYTGFIAQEVLKAAREIGFDFSGVRVPEHPATEAYGLRYAEFVVPLTRAVQELDELARDVNLRAGAPASQSLELNGLAAIGAEHARQVVDEAAVCARRAADVRRHLRQIAELVEPR